jgi:hypothetical protein
MDTDEQLILYSIGDMLHNIATSSDAKHTPEKNEFFRKIRCISLEIRYMAKNNITEYQLKLILKYFQGDLCIAFSDLFINERKFKEIMDTLHDINECQNKVN